LAKLPSKKIIRLTIFLVILVIGVFWYLGYQNQRAESQKLELYRQQILNRQKNLETAVLSGSDGQATLPALVTDWSTIELTLIEPTDTEALMTYGRGLTGALKPFSLKRKSEIKLALDALDGNDPTKIKELVTARLNHEIAAATLRHLPVPEAVADWHRQLINSLENSALLIGQMEKILTEPVIGLAAGQVFLRENVFFYQTIDKINDYFRRQGIDFPDNEKLELYVNFNQ